MLTPVILSGGSGTRLWPLSREALPKQFLTLTSEKSLLAQTLRRACSLEHVTRPILVCNEEHRFVVAATVQQVIPAIGADILLEPVGRNTAPAIALSALQALNHEQDPLLLVMPSDQVIQDEKRFADAVAIAARAATVGHLVTFGIVPDAAHTGYGYIKQGASHHEWCEIGAFVEKPSKARAEDYLASKNYWWNSGMFVFKARQYLEILGQYQPDMMRWCQLAFERSQKDLDFIRIDKPTFAACPGESIDYAVMEKASNAVVVPLDAGWSDIGSWSALWEIIPQDPQGNVIRGDVITEQVKNSYIHSEGRLIAALGLDDCIIVDTGDVVLVANKDHAQDVKKIVEQIKARDRQEHRFHRKVHRPWGTYEGVAQAERFQVKRITVNPGARLSLQKHHHRAEHWVVVKGTATITRGSEAFQLTEDQSTYIPLGVMHRLENPGVIPLEIIEVQTGSYLGEDDIVRIDDKYGRV